MFYKRRDLPEENEIVLCTVKKILPNCVFAKLDEFDNLEGMIHISEIAPGRIRNIRDYVKENKKLVCKVIKSDKIRKHFDLSLRRASLAATKNKNNEINQELNAEKILETIARQLKISPEELYNQIAPKIIEQYNFLHLAFQDIINNSSALKEIQIDQDIKNLLIKTVKEKIKIPEVALKSILVLQSKESNGIDIIKNVLKKAYILANQKQYKLKILYIGSPRYELTVTSGNYKHAEKILQEASELIVNELLSQKGEASWEKKS